MNRYYIIISLALLIAVFVIYVYEHVRELYIIYKPIPIVLYLTVLIYAAAVNSLLETHYSVFIAGMLFGLAGDFLLIKKKFLIWGLLSFLTGHILYIVYFLSLGFRFDMFLFIIIFSISLTYFIFFIRVLPEAKRKRFLIPIIFYLTGITVMLYSAVNSDLMQGTFYFYSFGAVLFYISDGTIAYEKFIKKIHHGSIPILSTYYLAQALLTIGILKSMNL
ncbi:MAG: lysoplasmalogenase [Spirochaetes bacterium]|nr:lysoplasmalogenase [Spirochaetota bacterium]